MSRVRYTVAVLLFWLSQQLSAQSPQVLIVNTDDSVYKYQEIANEFKKVLTQHRYAWTEVNLALPNNERQLKQLIQNADTDLIYCIGTKAYALTRQLSEHKKLIFAAAINWRRLTLTDSSYGIANELSPLQELSLLQYFFPHLKKIGLLYNETFSQEYVTTIKQETTSLGLTIIGQPIDTAKDIESALRELLPQIDLFWIISDPVLLSSNQSVQRIFQLAEQQRKPIYAYSDVFIEQGAVLAISADIATIGRQSANLIMRVAHEQLPAGTVQVPAGSTITLNKCATDHLLLNFNQDALDSVNRLINCKPP